MMPLAQFWFAAQGQATQAWLLAQGDGEPSVWQRLDPVRRAKLLMALFALLLVGLLLVALAMIGARYVRRLARHRPGAGRTVEDRWYEEKPLVIDDPDTSAEDEP